MSSEEQRRSLEENGRRIGEHLRTLERARLVALMEMHREGRPPRVRYEDRQGSHDGHQ